MQTSQTRDYKITVRDRLARDPEFVKAMIIESISLVVKGEADVACDLLVDIVTATFGFKKLAEHMNVRKPCILYAALSGRNDPGILMFSKIIKAITELSDIDIAVTIVTPAPANIIE